MLGTLRKGGDHIDALKRIEAWTRARFSLVAEDAVLVSEIACKLPGCPPLETLIAFWTAPNSGEARRHRIKVFKAVREVVEDDLPPGWYRDELIDEGTGDACC